MSMLRLFSVSLASTLLLAACSSTPMPTGYTYQHETYRTPPGPEAKAPQILATGQDATSSMGGAGSGSPASGLDLEGGSQLYTATASMDANGHWDAAADELVEKILRDLGKPMEKVDVPGNDDFVTALKASLTRHDIPVMTRMGDGPFLIKHEITGRDVTIHFFSNHENILSESGNFPTP